MTAPESFTLKPVKTTCPYCGVGCGVIATIDEKGNVDIAGDKEHPANFGRLCSKGSALGETTDLNHRLLYPQIKQKQVNWDTALQTVADKFSNIISEHGPDSVAFYVSGQLLTEDYYVANKLMKGYIGSGNIDTNSRLCMSSAVAGHKRAFGNDSVALCYDDLEQAECIVVIGSNLAWCHPVLFQRIEKVRNETGMKLIVIDPRRTTSCDSADLHLPLKPGTDAFFFNGLLNYLNEANVIDTDFIQQHTNGFDESLLAARNSSADINTVAEVCELDAELVKNVYETYARTKKIISFFSMGINQSSSGVDKVNAIINAHLAMGKIGQPGTGAFSITGQPNAMGGREVGGLANVLAAHMDFSEHDIVQRFWQSPVIAKQAGLKAVDLFNDLNEGRIKAIWIMATNPAVSIPNANLVQQAMEKCDFVVVSDCIQNTDTTRYADVLLPAHAWGEKSGTVTNSERRISRQKPFMLPAGEAKADWWIIAEVAKRMGFENGFNFDSAAAVFREHAALSGFENSGERDFDISGFSELDDNSYDDLPPIQWPVNNISPNGRARLFEDKQFYTSDKRANFISIIPRFATEETDEEYPLRLNTGRVRDHWHTMTRTAKSQRLSKHVREPYVQCHPDTAEQFSLKDKALALVHSRWGETLLRVDITDRQRPGELFIPIHWNDQFSANASVDKVVNPYTDPVSGQPEFKHTTVSIKPVTHHWHGFLLSKQELDLSRFPYWSKFREQDCWQYEFSDTQAYDLSSFKELIAHPESYNWIEYRNELDNSERHAWFNGEELQGCLFIAENLADLPSRNWLTEQFSESEFTGKQRFKLMAGMAAADRPDPGPAICICFNVGRNTIINSILEKQHKTIECIGNELKAGTNCGSCRPELKCLIEETLPT